MTAYIFPVPHLEAYDRYCYFDKYFSDEECDRIISLAETFPIQDAEIGKDHEGMVSHDIRKSKVRWLYLDQHTSWLYDRLYVLVLGANVRYNFILSGFHEPMQFTKYEAPGSHYKWHQDSGNQTFSIRKLSLVVHLSEPSDYEGGELELFDMGPGPKSRGTVVVFPSFEQHRVTPVTSGVRHSLVVWVSGPPYR